MRLRSLKIVVLTVLVGVLASPAAHGQTIKIATLAPDGSFWMNEVRSGADEIAKRTAGRVTLRFYPGGSMGNEASILRKIRIGQLQGGVFTAGTLVNAYPDVQILSLPLVFDSYGEVDCVRRTMDPVLVSGLAENGFVSFGLIEGGFAYLLSNRATRSFDDLKGQKTWIPEGDTIGQAILEAGGLTPIPLPLSDVLTGLQTGLIDTVAGPPVGAVALQWFTKAKYLTEVPIVYTYGSIVISDGAFNRISAADQEIVRQVLTDVSQRLDARSRSDNKEAKAALAKQGVEFVPMTADSSVRWHEVATKATAMLAERGVMTRPMMERVQTLLAECRKGNE